MKPMLLIMAMLAFPLVHAQHHDNAHAGHGAAPPPHRAHSHYAGMTGRTIKALSEQQIADLRSGKGMSLALPAELNGYPGPAHVLELADQLRLSPAQRQKTQQLTAEMEAEAKRLGEELIARERKLDKLFSERRADARSVQSAAAASAAVQGALRNTHLQYHLRMLDVLSAEQVAGYNKLRGYRK